MESIFISYSTTDKFFAELLAHKLAKEKINVWRDVAALRAGEEWRQSIDIGIAKCKIMIVVLSKASCASHYVTYEWATALAAGKAIVPVLLEGCDRHPKLEPLQYIDFSRHNDGTWQILIQRIQEMFSDTDSWVEDEPDKKQGGLLEVSAEEVYLTNKILGYMNKKGFRMITFSRIRDLFGETLSDQSLEKLVLQNEHLRLAKLRDNEKGLMIL